MVNPAFRAGEKLPAAKLQQLGYDDTFTPVLGATTTPPDLGAGATQAGLIWVNGNKVDIWFDIIFGSSGAAAGSGTYQIALPAELPFAANFPSTFTIGTAYLHDATATPDQAGIIADPISDLVRFRRFSNNAQVTNAVPWTWAVNDAISGHFSYLTDFGA